MKIETMLRAFAKAVDNGRGYRPYIEIGDGIIRRYEALQAERDETYRELCEVKDWDAQKEVDALQAENARLVSLSEQIADLMKSIPSPEEVARLQAENARLRAELEQIRTIQAASKTIEIVIPEGWGEPGIHLPDVDAAHDA